MRPYPLTFHPIFKEKIWGGRVLEQFGKSLPTGATVGESWELADVTHEPGFGQSVIANGELAGMTLRDATAAYGEMIMGAAASRSTRPGPTGAAFPLLIKYLDAHDNLSVQVHPSEAYAAAHPETNTKHEAWVILRAEPGAVIYLGLKSGVTRERFLAHLAEGNPIAALNTVAVRPGMCFHIPSGAVHALGAGITLAEVQTSSDWTFRLYDWGRETTPQRREMHIEQALQCIEFGAQPAMPGDEATAGTEAPIEVGGIRTTPLTHTPHFDIERIDVLTDARLDIVTSGIPEVWMMLSGRGQICTDNKPILDISRGRTVLLPAALSELEPAAADFSPDSSLLRITLPSPITGMIA